MPNFSALNLISRLSNQGIEEETKLTQRISYMHFFYLSVNVFSTKVLIGDTIFYVSNWRRDRRHFTWCSEPREGLPACSAKGVPSFLGYFKTLSIGPAPEIEPATSRSAFNTLYRHTAAVPIRHFSGILSGFWYSGVFL